MNRRRIFLIIASIVLAAIVVFFAGRNFVLRKAVGMVSDELSVKFNATLSIVDIRFSGLTAVSASGILISSHNGDTIIYIDTVRALPSFSKFISGRIGLNELYLDRANINFACLSDTCNFSRIPPVSNAVNDTVDAPVRNNTKQFGQSMNSLYRRIFDVAPQQALLRNIHISLRNDTIHQLYFVDSFESTTDSIHGSIEELSGGNKWLCSGTFSQGERLIDVRLYPSRPGTFFPAISELFSATLSFDTVKFSIREHSYNDGIFSLRGNTGVTNLTAFHTRISEDTVRIPDAAFQFAFHAGKNSFTLDSTSVVRLGQISMNPFINITSEDSMVYEIKLRTDTIPASGFFSSLPEGIFEVVRDIRAEGTLRFEMDFRFDQAFPDSVDFSCKMSKDGFRITASGNSGLFRMRDEFTHYVYENGRLFRSMTIGPSNDDFTPIEKISPYLKNAILTSEDGSFYYHNGFNAEAFRKSIAENYKAGRFVKGGSTITMQLVKNIFLTRRKTIARKAEEALIVWLIESNRLYTKDRLFEVYLNIIELGPNVYGVSEASRFYFDKQPSEITLAEGIFLSHLLPHPKWVKSSFDSTGALKPYLADYYRNVANFMMRRELITEEEQASLVPEVKIKGPAKEFLFPEDTLRRRWWFW